MPRRRRPSWLRSLRRELTAQRRDNGRAVLGLLILWLLGSAGGAIWLWNSHWQRLVSEQNRRRETQRGLIDLRVDSHKVTALDWGHWDPLHRYAGGQDPDFVQREVLHSSIIRDGQVLAIARNGAPLVSYPGNAVSPPLQRCLQQRLIQLQQRGDLQPPDQSFGFYCRAGAQAWLGAGTTIRATESRGPVRGWLLHFSRIERPSYNAAVNAAFRSISAALTADGTKQPPPGASRVESISELLPRGKSFALTAAEEPLRLQARALQQSVLPWLSLNALVAIGAGGSLLGLRRMRQQQRRSEWLNRSRLRQLRQELPGPLLSQRELLDRISGDGNSLEDRWIAALRLRVTLFSGVFSRGSAQTHALGQLGERLQRRPGTDCLALGEESSLLLVFQPDTPRRPERELEHLAQLLHDLHQSLAQGMKLRISGLITPLDRQHPRQQLSDLALVLSLTGEDERPLLFQPQGVADQAARLRRQLHIDFSVSQLVENLREHRYELEPILALQGDGRRIVYSEMLFRLPVDMQDGLTIQEVILSLERNDNIHLIDQLMLRKAIELLRENRASGQRLGINLSAITFCSGQHFEDLLAQLRGLPESLRSSLVLEITETAIVEKSERWSVKLQQLRDLGVRIAIDDFGVGFASIAYLFRFRPDYLKLDLSYSQRLDDCNASALVDFLLAYAQHNNCQLILEGIETGEQLAFWRNRGVDLFQGYLFKEAETPQ